MRVELLTRPWARLAWEPVRLSVQYCTIHAVRHLARHLRKTHKPHRPIEQGAVTVTYGTAFLAGCRTSCEDEEGLTKVISQSAAFQRKEGNERASQSKLCS